MIPPQLAEMFRRQQMQGPMGPGMQMPQRPMPGQMGPMQQFAPPGGIGATPGINPVENPMSRTANTIGMSMDNPEAAAAPGMGGMAAMMPMMMGMMNQGGSGQPVMQQQMDANQQQIQRMQQIAMMMRERMQQ